MFNIFPTLPFATLFQGLRPSRRRLDVPAPRAERSGNAKARTELEEPALATAQPSDESRPLPGPPPSPGGEGMNQPELHPVEPEPVSGDPPAIQLSVIVPMFNEEENVELTVNRLRDTLRRFPDGPWEIILVNDGSLDRTMEIARELSRRPGYECVRVVGYRRNRGRGFALRTGFAAARGRWVVSIDADLSYEPEYILRLTDVLREEEDIDMVLASAYMPGGGVVNAPLFRHLVSRFGNVLLSWFMSSGRNKVHTITCVFRAYRREVLDDLELESEGKDIHLEILSKAMMLGYRFREVPATLKWRTRGKSKFRFGTTALSHLIFALFERPILVFGLFGILLMLCSFGIMGYLAVDYLRNGFLTEGRPMFTLVLLAFLGGLQLLAFGIIGTQFVTLRKEIVRMQRRLRELTSRDRGRPAGSD